MQHLVGRYGVGKMFHEAPCVLYMKGKQLLLSAVSSSSFSMVQFRRPQLRLFDKRLLLSLPALVVEACS